MKIQYTGRHFQVDDRVRAFAESKLGKLAKFLDDPVELHLTLEIEKRRQIAELHVSHRHGVLQAKEAAEQMFDAIHAVAEKIEKQARRSRQKHQDQRRRAGRQAEGRYWPLEVLDKSSLRAGIEPKVIKTAHLPIKPMTIDEAALDLESSKNEFFVFFDSATDRVSVLYRRQDGHYGLIAPEF